MAHFIISSFLCIIFQNKIKTFYLEIEQNSQILLENKNRKKNADLSNDPLNKDFGDERSEM